MLWAITILCFEPLLITWLFFFFFDLWNLVKLENIHKVDDSPEWRSSSRLSCLDRQRVGQSVWTDRWRNNHQRHQRQLLGTYNHPSLAPSPCTVDKYNQIWINVVSYVLVFLYSFVFSRFFFLLLNYTLTESVLGSHFLLLPVLCHSKKYCKENGLFPLDFCISSFIPRFFGS